MFAILSFKPPFGMLSYLFSAFSIILLNKIIEIITIPLKPSYQAGPILTMFTALLITATKIVPNITPRIVPFPPEILTAPITHAAIASRRIGVPPRPGLIPISSKREMYRERHLLQHVWRLPSCSRWQIYKHLLLFGLK
jgi:hypothetical protein